MRRTHRWRIHAEVGLRPKGAATVVMTPVTLLAATLLAVTFGWVPAERVLAEGSGEEAAGQSSVEPAGYEYHVRLTRADLNALRDGRSDSLSSALPKDLGSVERVRITVGEGPAPRLLTSVDQAAGKEQKLEPVRRVVAKPVIDDWPDAATLTGQRRTAYQNPTLQEGFRDGTRPLRDATEWTRQQATAGAERVRNSFNETGDTLRRTTRDLLDGTGKSLEALVPGSEPRAGAYDADYQRRLAEGNPGYDPYAQPLPAEPTQAEDPRGYAGQTPDPYDLRRRTEPLREPGRSPSVRSGFDDPLFAQEDPRGPVFGGPNDEGRSSDVLSRFTEDDDSYTSHQRRPLTPVERRRAQPADYTSRDESRSASDGFGTQSPYRAGREDIDRQAESQGRIAGSDDFPARSPARPAWAVDPGREAPPSGGYERPVTTGGTGSSWTAGLGAADGQAGDSNSQSTATGGQIANDRERDSTYFEKLLLVILGAVTCFTWIAYIDVRNKYRMALRGLPTAGFGHGVTA